MYAVLVLMVNGFYGFSRGYLSVSPPGISAAVSLELILGRSNSNDCLAASGHVFSGQRRDSSTIHAIARMPSLLERVGAFRDPRASSDRQLGLSIQW